MWLAFHATPTDLFSVIPVNAPESVIERDIIGDREHRLFLYGHIHLPYVRKYRDRTIVNLGSVGLPFDGVAQASYAVIDTDKTETRIDMRRVPYDVEKAAERLESAGYPRALYVAEILRQGRLPS